MCPQVKCGVNHRLPETNENRNILMRTYAYYEGCMRLEVGVGLTGAGYTVTGSTNWLDACGGRDRNERPRIAGLFPQFRLAKRRQTCDTEHPTRGPEWIAAVKTRRVEERQSGTDSKCRFLTIVVKRNSGTSFAQTAAVLYVET